MKKAILVFVFIISQLGLFSQTYYAFPDSNATWVEFHGGAQHGCYVDQEEFEIYISKDTLINSLTYKQVNFHAYHSSQQIFGGMCIMPSPYYYDGIYTYFRNDTLNRRVYFRFPNDTTENLMYDFSKLPGDTIYVNVNFSYRIDSLDSVLIGGSYRLAQNISGYNIWVGSQVIEGIGAKRNGIVLHWPWIGGGDELMCFSQNNQKLYPDTNGVCQHINTISSYSQQKIKIFPNPASDKIFILGATGESSVKISNVLGEMIIETQVQVGNLDISNLKEGIYFLDVLQENRIIERKKIVISR